jgi:hypothetical protein
MLQKRLLRKDNVESKGDRVAVVEQGSKLHLALAGDRKALCCFLASCRSRLYCAAQCSVANILLG